MMALLQQYFVIILPECFTLFILTLHNNNYVCFYYFPCTLCFQLYHTLAGQLGNLKGQLFGLKINDTQVGGPLFEKDAADVTLQEQMEGLNPDVQGEDVTSLNTGGWFSFFQTEDGDIAAVYHSKEEDAGIVNFKKQITASLQANFKGTASRTEADPTSSHVARYM